MSKLPGTGTAASAHNVFPRVTISDGVTTFMYASAANVILANSVALNHHAFFLAYAAILFIFIDWLARIRIPVTFPEEDQAQRRTFSTQLIKGFLEILCVLCLIVTAISFLKPVLYLEGMVGWQFAFPLFLLASFGWNIVVLSVMKGTSWSTIARATYNGTALELDAAKEYIPKFHQAAQRLESKIQDAQDVQGGKRVAEDLIGLACLGGLARTFAQLIAFHIAFANIAAGVLLTVLIYRPNVLSSFFQNLPQSYLYLFFFLSVALIAFCIYEWRTPDARGCSAIRKIAAISFLLSVGLFYLRWSSDVLMIIILAQHAIFGIFFQFAVRDTQRPIPGVVANEIVGGGDQP